MRVKIDEIKEAGLRRAWDVSRDTLDEIVRDDPAGYRARDGARVEGELHKLDERVILGATAQAPLTAPCGRCLTQVSHDVPVRIDRTFVPAAGGGSGGDDDAGGSGPGRAGSFDVRDADEETYSGKTIDLDPVLREAVLLALPPYPVCSDGCKGLCPVCGANLNERDCGCDRSVPDPRWAGLQKLRDKSKER